MTRAEATPWWRGPKSDLRDAKITRIDPVCVCVCARARAAAAAAAASDALSADLPMSNSATYSNSGEEVCRRACLRARARACVRVRVCVCARAGVCVRG